MRNDDRGGDPERKACFDSSISLLETYAINGNSVESNIDGAGKAVECDVCAMFGPSCCVMFCRVPLCSIVYCLCLPLPLLGHPVGTYGDRGYHVH